MSEWIQFYSAAEETKSKTYCQEEPGVLVVMVWSSQSPDLNLIKSVFVHMKPLTDMTSSTEDLSSPNCVKATSVQVPLKAVCTEVTLFCVFWSNYMLSLLLTHFAFYI